VCAHLEKGGLKRLRGLRTAAYAKSDDSERTRCACASISGELKMKFYVVFGGQICKLPPRWLTSPLSCALSR
jgi:hypothetical protein